MSDSEALEKKQRRRLLAVLVVTSAFCGVKLVGASMAKSNVLHADALHLFLDIGALSMALLAMRVAAHPPTDRYPFGLRRIEPLAALANGLLVLVASVYIVAEGLESLHAGHEPVPAIMMVVSIVALFINGASAYLLHGAMGHDHGVHDRGPPPAAGNAEASSHADCAHDHGAHDHGAHEHEHAKHPPAPHAHAHHAHADHSLNLRGALLHLAGDALGALAAFATAVAIWLGAPRIVDPLASFLVAAILFVAALRLLRDPAAETLYRALRIPRKLKRRLHHRPVDCAFVACASCGLREGAGRRAMTTGRARTWGGKGRRIGIVPPRCARKLHVRRPAPQEAADRHPHLREDPRG